MRRRAGAALAVGVVLSLSALVSGCSQQDALGLARQACAHVAKSMHFYDEGLTNPVNASARHELQEANNQLQDAEPLAAAATSDDGEWNALMTTLQESGRVDEGHLLVALKAQCAVANTPGPAEPPVQTTLPPVPGHPQHPVQTTTSTAVPSP
jgi:outer membrane lipopolysaccharide assembly protein LptE/RlpB